MECMNGCFPYWVSSSLWGLTSLFSISTIDFRGGASPRSDDLFYFGYLLCLDDFQGNPMCFLMLSWRSSSLVNFLSSPSLMSSSTASLKWKQSLVLCQVDLWNLKKLRPVSPSPLYDGGKLVMLASRNSLLVQSLYIISLVKMFY